MSARIIETMTTELVARPAGAPDLEIVPDRDDATRDALLAGAQLANVEPLAFGYWWDGAAWSPCLAIRGGRRNRQQRLVETGGDVVVLPWSERAARRRLAALRAAAPFTRVVPPPRRPGDPVSYHVDAGPDGVRCRHQDCGALLPVPAPGEPAPDALTCPACGRL